MRKRRARAEDALQRSVASFLDVALPWDACWFAVPNGGGRSKVEAAILRATGTKAGAPDLMVFHNCRAYGVEIKAPPKMLKSGRLSRAKPRTSDDQDAMHAKLHRAGVTVTIARSIDDVASFLRDHNVPLRAAPIVKGRSQ